MVTHRLAALADKTETEADDLATAAIVNPLGLILPVVGVYLALRILLTVGPSGWTPPTRSSRWSASWWSPGPLFKLADALAVLLNELAAKTDSKLDDQVVPLLRKALKIFLAVLAFILVAQNLGYSVSGLLAGLGIGGLALAMAAKDTLANLFGSLMILIDRPFHVGDWITFPGGDGVVEEVGLRSTRVRTFAKTVVSIPNQALANATVENHSLMPKRRIKFTLGVTYESTVDQVRDAGRRASRTTCKGNPDIDQEFMLVKFTEFNDSSLDIFVYCFTVTTDWTQHLSVRQDVNLKIMEMVEEMGMSIAFPTQTVHLVDESELPAAGRIGSWRTFRLHLSWPGCVGICSTTSTLTIAHSPNRELTHDLDSTRFPEDRRGGRGRRHRRRPDRRPGLRRFHPPEEQEETEDPDPGRHRLPGPGRGEPGPQPRPRGHPVQPRQDQHRPVPGPGKTRWATAFGDLEALETARGTWSSTPAATSPTWSSDSAELLEGRVEQYIFISSISVYADFKQRGLNEKSPVGVITDEEIAAAQTMKDITGLNYGPLKALCEQAADNGSSAQKACNIRPGLIVGPMDRIGPLHLLARAHRQGRRGPGPGHARGRPPRSSTCATWPSSSSAAPRRTPTASSTPPRPPEELTMGELFDTCKSVSGSDATFTWVEPEFLEENEVAAWSRHARLGASGGRRRRPSLHERRPGAEAAGLTFRPISETVRGTLDWWDTVPQERKDKPMRSGIDGRTGGRAAGQVARAEGIGLARADGSVLTHDHQPIRGR